MKKIVTTTFCAVMLCSLLLLTVGTTMAAEPGYERFSRPTVVPPTIDGMWTTEDEWTDGELTWIGTDVAFTSTWDMVDDVYTRWIIEFFSDTTDDPNDLWRFCIDGTIISKFEIDGHTQLAWYIMTGGIWTVTDIVPEGEIIWANSLSASPTNSTPHWILEFQIAKNSGQIQMDILWNFYLEAYDASNPGVHAWPPTDPNVPERWGVENYSTEAIPEGLTFGIMVLLSTVSMLVGYKYIVKQKETKAQ